MIAPAAIIAYTEQDNSIGVPTGGEKFSPKAEMEAGISRSEPLNLMRIIPTEEKMRNTKLIAMIEGAIIAGVCVALSFIPLSTANASFDLSLGLIPLGVYALRRGALPGMAVGFVWGLLLIVLGKAYILAIPQVLLEYPVAFAFGGFGGILAPMLRNELSKEHAGAAIRTVVFSGILTAVTRWFFHFLAGLIFWGSYAPEGVSPLAFSLFFNGTSAAANALMLAVVLPILLRAARPLFVPKT